MMGQAGSLGPQTLAWTWNHDVPPGARVSWEPGVTGASQQELCRAGAEVHSEVKRKAPLSMLG